MNDDQIIVERMAVKMPINENFFEQVIIEHLRDKLGYDYLFGPSVPRDGDGYHDVFLSTVLLVALTHINPSLPDEAIVRQPDHRSHHRPQRPGRPALWPVQPV